ncbi:hypothetical protein HPE56_08775 [Maribacter sp. ANRC-HE7]|uniref:DoxX-like family protein n=1 Tax=Maribacter aquimaris TaxID=2737171 RepID=A0ABR7V2F6_9FLAO|nr:hypothetical protein [Maribacter aquimaris]MBD0777886.1 hypothetical protein [Maribacter aquimaris]
MKILKNQWINIVASAMMLFFAIPKLLGQPQSKAGFEHFGKALKIDADIFRVFTGLSELGLAIVLLVFIFTKRAMLGKFAFLFLLAMMLTALGLEFFARPEPKMVLVVIAIILAAISIYRLKTIK